MHVILALRIRNAITTGVPGWLVNGTFCAIKSRNLDQKGLKDGDGGGDDNDGNRYTSASPVKRKKRVKKASSFHKPKGRTFMGLVGPAEVPENFLRALDHPLQAGGLRFV